MEVCRNTDDFEIEKQWDGIIDSLLERGLTKEQITSDFSRAVQTRIEAKRKAAVKDQTRAKVRHLISSYISDVYGAQVEEEIPLGRFYTASTNLLDLLDTVVANMVKNPDDNLSLGNKADATAEEILANFVKNL